MANIPELNLSLENTKEETSSIPELKLALLTPAEIHAAYMPFVRNGGVFYATKEPFSVGGEVNLSVKIMDLPLFELLGRVVWITPVGAQNGIKAGIGLQFIGEKGQEIVRHIETRLAGTQYLGQRSDTL
jgi:type IV pilus assembly protein PilZ